MNATIDPARARPDNWLHSEPGPIGQERSASRTVRRTGRKAVRFDGWQLIEAMGSSANRSVWHDLNVFRTIKGRIVVELVVRHNSAERHDLSRVETFDDLDEAAAWLEGYRPADDAVIPGSLGVVDTALPWAVLEAVQLRQGIDRIELDFRTLLSEVFAALDLTDPAEPLPRPPAPPKLSTPPRPSASQGMSEDGSAA